MRPTPGEQVAVVGAGRMGLGIAYVFASAGRKVRLQDPDAGQLGKVAGELRRIDGLLGHPGADPAANVECCDSLGSAVAGADVVIEAAPERLELKQDIFEAVSRMVGPDAILASNTSVIPIGAIAARAADPGRVIGAHFWNPPYLVRLVEVVAAERSESAAVDGMMGLLAAVGHKPVLVRKDIPGFVGNRLQHALKREAIALVAAGVCNAETVDEVVKLGFGSRLSVLGPLEQSDMVGLDLTKAIHDVVLPDLDTTPHTQAYLSDLVSRGELGMKTGKGFRSWTPEQAREVRDRLESFLMKTAAERASHG